MFDFINKPFGFILEKLADLFGGSFAWAVFAFTLVINIILIPLTIKSQKSSVQQTRIKPKLDELKKRYGNDKQKFAAAQQQLYQEENVSMSGGCLPMLLRLIIMMSIYTLILSPLTYMAGVDDAKVDNVVKTVNSVQESDKDAYKEFTDKYNWDSQRSELGLVSLVRNENGKEVVRELVGDEKFAKIEEDYDDIVAKDKETHINYDFVTEKIDLTEKPDFSFDIINAWHAIWIMPIFAFVAQILSSLLSMKINKKNNPDAPSMAGMMLTMPLISLFIGFTLPGGVTFYWACSSLIGGLIQVAVQYFYGPHKMLSAQRAKELVKQCDFESTQIEKLADKKL